MVTRKTAWGIASHNAHSIICLYFFTLCTLGVGSSGWGGVGGQ